MDDDGSQGRKQSKKNGVSYRLQSSDQPGVSLVNVVLNGRNYLPWSIAVKIALEAIQQVGFIDGSIKSPEDEEEYVKWKSVDSMIKTWIVNSIADEMSETFVYCHSSKALWDVLEEGFGGSNEDNNAMNVKGYQPKTKSSNPKKKDLSKKDKYCDHCKVNGHTKDTCFKIHGYLEWWKELKEKRTGKKPVAATVKDSSTADTPMSHESNLSSKADLANAVSYLLKEVQRLGKSKSGSSKDEQVNFKNL
ncbi:uncharacterized protein G2W53_041973 [Senna tora]|uniref:Retrotransposon Copia-like N-terminal domain-containing protein n=1 Tax=Senna tora TaxID=362788 RepID=A0A834SKU4_9FABA|nr:uncharacterized protein G2W53_041973 [Senna tora]